MRNFLVRVLAVVGEDTVTGLIQVKENGRLADGFEEAGDGVGRGVRARAVDFDERAFDVGLHLAAVAADIDDRAGLDQLPHAVLLAPQHFQQVSARMDALVAWHTLAVSPFGWGVRRMALDSALLPAGLFRRAAMVSQSPQMIQQWVQDLSNPQGAQPTWQAFPHATRARALIAIEAWIRGL